MLVAVGGGLVGVGGTAVLVGVLVGVFVLSILTWVAVWITLVESTIAVSKAALVCKAETVCSAAVCTASGSLRSVS